MGFNWKSYLFGFGSGMVLACAVFFVAFNIITEKQLRQQSSEPSEGYDVFVPSMTDEQIINKAKTLGMMFEDEYSQKNRISSTTEQAIQVQTAQQEEIADAVSDVEDAETKPTAGVDVTYKDVIIPDGIGCIEITQLIEDNGIVDSAAELNKYIVNHNMQKKLTKGLVKLPVGGEYELIANILTGKAKSR